MIHIKVDESLIAIHWIYICIITVWEKIYKLHMDDIITVFNYLEPFKYIKFSTIFF